MSPSSLDSAAASLSSLSSHLLHAELARRQLTDPENPDAAPQPTARPECGSSGQRASYNTSLHVFALFLILILSTLACSFPIIVRRFPQLPVPHRFLFLSRHFGTGVLIATAFVHLLPTAFVSLTDPCLPPFWNEGYPAMAGFIAMISVLVVVGVEMFFASKGARHAHGGANGYGELADDEHDGRKGLLEGSASIGMESGMHGRGIRHFRQSSIGLPEEGGTSAYAGTFANSGAYEGLASRRSGDSPAPSPHILGNDQEDDDADSLSALSDPAVTASKPSQAPANGHPHHISPPTIHQPTDEQTSARLLLQCLLLEAGILFHSVFIGMAVSVSVGPPFVVLLIAISFHQTFEGLALGSRIAAIPSFAPSANGGAVNLRPWLMALAYGTTTPVGQAIGLAVHNLYDPASEAGLLIVGIMNSVSSGLLLFAGLVELLAEDFLKEESYLTLNGRRRIEACGAVVAGCMLMALVGAWA